MLPVVTKVLGGEHGVHSRTLEGSRYVDPTELCMSVRAAHEGAVCHPR
jgi:hypothetical protein